MRENDQNTATITQPLLVSHLARGALWAQQKSDFTLSSQLIVHMDKKAWKNSLRNICQIWCINLQDDKDVGKS